MSAAGFRCLNAVLLRRSDQLGCRLVGLPQGRLHIDAQGKLRCQHANEFVAGPMGAFGLDLHRFHDDFMAVAIGIGKPCPAGLDVFP